MSLLKIFTINEINHLREISADVDPRQISSLNRLISDMIETMYKAPGVGLAAPQIDNNIQLAVISKEVTPDKKEMVLINPRLIKHSWRRVTENEGCLSCPNVSVPVQRYKKITVQTLDLNGKTIIFNASDFFARVVQHEMDHLNGVLIVDK